MRVYIDFELNGTGKSKFLERLIPVLREIDVDCAFSPKGCDIALGIAWQNNPIKGMPYILRLDGFSFQKDKWRYKKTINRTRNSIKQSNALIWQSQFCKKILGEMFPFSEHKKQFVIFNGANPRDYQGLIPIITEYTTCIIMSAHWFNKSERPNKRLKEMLEIAEWYCNYRSDVVFWVAGETNYKSPHDRIVMLGHLPEQELRRYLVSSTVMLYLAFYDWCPNAVVESLVAGTPVICSNNSGVAEIVGNNGGAILDIDRELRLKDLYKNPPEIIKSFVVESLDYICKDRVKKPELYIDNIAKQYKQAFEGVLNEKIS